MHTKSGFTDLSIYIINNYSYLKSKCIELINYLNDKPQKNLLSN
jgi:hypothetical protein